MNPYEKLLLLLSRRPWLGKHVAAPLDRRFHRGRFSPSSLGTGLHHVFLTTTGRRSGEPRVSPLTYIGRDDGTIAIVGTNWGQEAHPAWTYNLEADPRAAAEIDGTAFSVTARRASPEEFEQTWPRFVSLWPNYRIYRERTNRDIRMYLLEPEDGHVPPCE